MTEFSLPYVSVANSGDEYFHVSFEERKDGSVDDGPYILMQRQFESPDGGRVYVESHQRNLCGHVRITRATLSSGLLRVGLGGRPPRNVEIRFDANPRRQRQLARMLTVIIGPASARLE